MGRERTSSMQRLAEVSPTKKEFSTINKPAVKVVYYRRDNIPLIQIFQVRTVKQQ